MDKSFFQSLVQKGHILSVLVVVLFGFGASLLTAQTGEAAVLVEAEDSNKSLPNALLWKIDGNGLDSSSYLFGTIHLIDKKDFFYPDSLQDLLLECQNLVFEIDLNEMNNIGAQLGMLTKTFMNDGVTLRDLISEEDYGFVKDYFDEVGLPLFLFERMKPMFLTAFTSMDGGDIGEMQSEMTSYELELMEEGKKSEMDVSGLETMELQLSLFDSIPYKEQAQMLVESIKAGSENGSDQMDTLIHMYTTQNIEMLYGSISEEEGISDFEHILVTKRNISWIPVMENLMAQRPSFFAVGAGHLGGPSGVIRLLEQEGYTLTPISQHVAN